MLAWLLLASSFLPAAADLNALYAGRSGAVVVIDCETGETFRSDAAVCAEKFPPCSTFKIWNTAIGLETGVIAEPDALFWKWDGRQRGIEDWNADQTLRTAFAVSCVPAYQNLARQIGPERMAEWIKRLNYGDGNISSGLDVFWLPEKGRTSLLISPDEQAALIARLVNGKTAFSSHTREVLQDVMTAVRTPKGTLYGKTGTGTSEDGSYNLGWYVGYLARGGKTYAFAALLQGEKTMGKDARAVMEQIFRDKNLL